MNRLQEKAQGLKLGLYLHVPFCARQCDFCNFYQRPPSREEVQQYLHGIAKEFHLFPPPRSVNTIFWGGGTPGLLSAADLETLAGHMLHAMPTVAGSSSAYFSGATLGHPALAKPQPPTQFQEWTIEMAPATVKADKVKTLLDLGVTRFSMGIQSFQEEMLERLGRVHARSQVYRAYDILRECGADNINLDLIFAVPGQTPEQWQADLNEAIRLQPEHLSTYCLTFEEDTALWLRLRKGEIKPSDPEDEVRFYQLSWDLLQAAGYEQYEISNYAKPGYACQHNLDTWAMQEWLGYGPSASSQLGLRRRTHAHSLEEWLSGMESGQFKHADQVQLDNSTLAVDALIFGLRCNLGVNLDHWQQRFQYAPPPALRDLLNRLVDNQLLKVDNTHRLTPEGRLLADRIAVEIMEATE